MLITHDTNAEKLVDFIGSGSVTRIDNRTGKCSVYEIS